MVTSNSMSESEMGNRGSKSIKFYLKNLFNLRAIINKFIVKEQRVDGSYFGLLKPELRCILMGSERNYQTIIPSKQFNRNYSTNILKNSLNSCDPWFITGFTDAEGSFTIALDYNTKRQLNWRVQAKYQISLHIRDLVILEEIYSYFGVGSIGKSENMCYYSVSSLKDLNNIIIPHFLNYPLVTQKYSDFILFSKVIKIMNKKGHLTTEGLNEIVNIKSSMGTGLSRYAPNS